jgi:hypothetical protein
MSASTPTKVKHSFNVAFLPPQSTMRIPTFHEQSNQMLHQTSQNNHRRICANAIQAHRKDDN